MAATVPDSSWYRARSAETDVPSSCPYANVHKCYRYYASIYMLGKVKMITPISENKKAELDAFWEESGLAPVITEEDTGISGAEGKSSSFSNFCPEVTHKYLGYYASYLSRYADEIDKNIGQAIAEKENVSNDWRYEWAFVKECHFLDCSVYNQVADFNSKKIGKFGQLTQGKIASNAETKEDIFDVKPNFFGLGINLNAFYRWAKNKLNF